jgi:hypothetical protein
MKRCHDQSELEASSLFYWETLGDGYRHNDSALLLDAS